mmetsp:Transcript_21537/g.49950  ORF Transcript_21537/g.49950 Transcript_21537/m.49950 type:complete len:202 (+) Transcript_21537:359-964(+)
MRACPPPPTWPPDALATEAINHISSTLAWLVLGLKAWCFFRRCATVCLAFAFLVRAIAMFSMFPWCRTAASKALSATKCLMRGVAGSITIPKSPRTVSRTGWGGVMPLMLTMMLSGSARMCVISLLPIVGIARNVLRHTSSDTSTLWKLLDTIDMTPIHFQWFNPAQKASFPKTILIPPPELKALPMSVTPLRSTEARESS